jgi:steroid delta-isomerase-like uncharacterized protein
MSLEENKVIVRNFLEALNKQDLSLLDDFVAADYFDHTNNFKGLDNVKQAITTFYKAFPDFNVKIEDIIAEGDKVWVHDIETGTHKGEYHGIAPSGKKITFACVDIFKVMDGKIAEAWHIYDFIDFYKQLGIIEYTKKGKKLFPKED